MDVAGQWLWFQAAAPHRGVGSLYVLGDFCSHLAVLELSWARLCVQQSYDCSRDIAGGSYKLTASWNRRNLSAMFGRF